MSSLVRCPTCQKPGVAGSFINCGCNKPTVKSLPILNAAEIRAQSEHERLKHKPDWQLARYEICKQCPFYAGEGEEQCKALPDGRNYLWRRRGLPRKRSRCPQGHWESVVPDYSHKKLLNKPPIPKWHYITVDELARDIQDLIPRLPPISGVACVPVSGGGAWQLASALHVPFYQCSIEYGLEPMRHGLRGRTREVDPSLPILILDDTVSSGWSWRQIKNKLGPGNYLFVSVYAKAYGMGEVDFYGTEFEEPHLMEWNIANTGYYLGLSATSDVGGAGIALDFDGVVSQDPPREFNERDVYDRQAYIEWLANAPIGPIVPRMYEVPLICSYRCEYTRKATEHWLERHGVKYKELRLWPDAPGARNFDGQWKAKAYAEKDYGLFIESCPRQAAAIAQATGKKVLCTETRKVI